MDFEPQRNDYTPSTQSTDKTEFWKNFKKDGCSIIKDRDIPIDRVIDTMLKKAGVYCENLSGVKEVKKMDSTKRNMDYESGMNSAFDSKRFANTSVESSRSLNAPDKPATETECDAQLDYLNEDRIGQASMSEPALDIAKDRGDIPQDSSTADNLTANDYSGDGKHLDVLENQDIKGCIYIKHSGKVFKAVIEAKSFEKENNDIFRASLKNRKGSVISDSILNKKLKDDVFERNGFKFSSNEYGDFDIAIFLSGLKCISGKFQQTKGMPDSKCKRNQSRCKDKKRKLKVAKSIKSSNATVHKVYGNVHGNHPTPSKSLSVFRNERRKSSRLIMPTYRTSQSNAKIDLSSDESDSYIYLINEDGSKQKLKEIIEDSRISLKSDDKNQEKQDMGSIYSCSRHETSSHRTRKVSQSSISPYDDLYGVPKLKISDGELWKIFENVFRSYASTSRHSGEVIAKKTSTEWMVNAGIVGEILTEKEAGDAFKNAVGVKITMNAQEYKDFLIELTIRMKLPYYEIYRRMCGV